MAGDKKHLSKETLVLLAYREAGFAESVVLRLHILFCSGCKREWKETTAVLKSVRQKHQEAPSHLVERVLDLARSTLSPVKRTVIVGERLPQPAFPRFARILVPAAAVLTIAALYLVSSVINQDAGVTHRPHTAGDRSPAVEAGLLAYVLSSGEATGLEIEKQIYDVSERISLAFLSEDASGFDLAVSDVENRIQEISDRLQDTTQL